MCLVRVVVPFTAWHSPVRPILQFEVLLTQRKFAESCIPEAHHYLHLDPGHHEKHWYEFQKLQSVGDDLAWLNWLNWLILENVDLILSDDISSSPRGVMYSGGAANCSSLSWLSRQNFIYLQTSLMWLMSMVVPEHPPVYNDLQV